MGVTTLDDTFAEAFPMVATRLIVTAADAELALAAANAMCGNASSVIGCDAEAGIDGELSATDSPDGRAGVQVLVFAFSRKALEKAVVARVGQNVLTCPTTACYAGFDGLEHLSTTGEATKVALNFSEPIKLGSQLRFFGDGFQRSKKLGERRLWRIPVMDGEFLCDELLPTVNAIGGGNLIVCGASQRECLAATRLAVTKMQSMPDVILPFPSGIVRSGSKVGAKYAQMRASTNEAWCPTLRGHANSELRTNENCVYEIVLDGLNESAIASAMQAGIDVLLDAAGVTRISAGNYGGKLGPHHFPLHGLQV